MLWRAAAFAPVWVCQRVSAMGEPDSSMSAVVGAGAGDAAPLHAEATTMTAAMIASFNRMCVLLLPLGPLAPRHSHGYTQGSYPRIPVLATPWLRYRCANRKISTTGAITKVAAAISR